jgi:hypothetical protein
MRVPYDFVTSETVIIVADRAVPGPSIAPRTVLENTKKLYAKTGALRLRAVGALYFTR